MEGTVVRRLDVLVIRSGPLVGSVYKHGEEFFSVSPETKWLDSFSIFYHLRSKVTHPKEKEKLIYFGEITSYYTSFDVYRIL